MAAEIEKALYHGYIGMLSACRSYSNDQTQSETTAIHHSTTAKSSTPSISTTATSSTPSTSTQKSTHAGCPAYYSHKNFIVLLMNIW